jgi:hypothetical protein
LQLVTLTLGGSAFIGRLACNLGKWCGAGAKMLRLEALINPHAPRDMRNAPPRCGAAVVIERTGKVWTPQACARLPREVTLAKPGLVQSNSPWFFLGYGPAHGIHRGTDRFDFSDPFFRVTRFTSLFSRRAPLTDPVAFLSRLHYRAVFKGRHPAKRALARLTQAIGEILQIDTELWNLRDCDFEQIWATLPSWKRRTLEPLLDAARHALDASPFQAEPLDIPCPILLDRPDLLFPPDAFPGWVSLIDRLYPGAQLIATLGEDALAGFPAECLNRSYPVPDWDGGRHPVRKSKARAVEIALIDVDGTLPNLALMKLSRHFKQQDRGVILVRHDERISCVEAAFASVVFSSQSSKNRTEKLRRKYEERLTVGGSGVDLASRLPPEIEALPPDFDLYPELGDRAIGFLTRGCPFKCPFCTVPVKEGLPRQVSDLDELLQGRKKLILLDDNILSHPKAAAFLEDMAHRGIEVNFNQTLDLRLVTREEAQILRRVRCANVRFTRRVYHFSLHSAENLDQIKKRFDLFGFTSQDNVEFVCMYGYSTTLEQDVARFRFLRSLQGAYVFVQEYCPVPWEPATEVPDFFGPNPDRLIRELVSICFAQNMKSMEQYYRWLSRRYALAYGELNQDLVDYIFRYNRRWRRGLYVATLAGTIAHSEALGM